MHPQLIDLDAGVPGLTHLSLPSYFSMVTIGFVIGLILARRFARRHGLDPRQMVDFILWMALFGVAGSRLLHVLADGHFWDYVHVCTDPARVDWRIDARECRALAGAWDEARAVCHPVERNCFAAFDVTAGGFAFYGGFVAAALYSIRFVRRHGWPAGKLVDFAGVALMIGLAWGRIGCFLASCCFGACSTLPWAVSFPASSAASRAQWETGLLETYRTASLAVHPTQLYEAVAGLAIAAIAGLWLAPRKRFDGQVFCVAAAGYAAARFLVEFLRRDERGGLLGLSTSQWLALAFLGASIYLWRVFSHRAARLLAAGEPR